MRPLALFVLLFAVRAAAAPVLLHIPPGVGLEEAERAALAARVTSTLAGQDIAVQPAGPLDDGCAADAACSSAALEKAGAGALLVIEVLRAGDEAEVTETVVDKAGATTSTANQTVSGGLDGFTLTSMTTAALKPLAVTAPPPQAPPTEAPRGDGRLGLGLALRADLAMLHGRTFGVTIDQPRLDNNLAGDGIKGFGGGWLLQLSWHLPIDGHWLNRAFGVEFDVGYTVSGTNGTVPFTQYETRDGVTSLVTTEYSYASVLHMVPLSLGLRSRLPLSDLGLPVQIDVSAGGSAVWGTSISTATVQGETVAFATDNAASDFAFGFYVEGGVAYRLGPGELTGAYRYVSTYLDFEHGDFNPGPGDLGGHHLLLGYRFTL